MAKWAIPQGIEDLEMSVAAKVADQLKNRQTTEFVFCDDSIVVIDSSAGTFAEIGDVSYIQLTYGVLFNDESGNGYDAHQTEYFNPDAYELASKAFVLRCNSKSPEKATGLGSTLEQISAYLKANDPLARARACLLIAWGNEKAKGSATARTVGLAALINDLDTLMYIPDAKQLEEDWKAECKRLIDSNQEIAAIKLYRAKSGLGLREAQFAVANLKSK